MSRFGRASTKCGSWLPLPSAVTETVFPPTWRVRSASVSIEVATLVLASARDTIPVRGTASARASSILFMSYLLERMSAVGADGGFELQEHRAGIVLERTAGDELVIRVQADARELRRDERQRGGGGVAAPEADPLGQAQDLAARTE